MLLALICYLVFLAADIISEFGVYSSSTCSPLSKYGLVTPANDSSDSALDDLDDVNLKRATIFAQLQTIPFIEGALSFVPSGFPADVNANVCTKCLDTPDRPAILRDCTVRDGRTYAPGELQVGVQKTKTLLKTLSVGINETGSHATKYPGLGDVIKAQNCTIFSFHMAEVNNTSNATLTYFEYANDLHCEEILKSTKETDDILWFETKGETFTQEIRCAESKLRPATFRDSVSLFRGIQVEFSLHRAKYDPLTERFNKLTVDDVYRAIIAAMLTNTDFQENEYFEYTDCGLYNWLYITPFMATVSLLLLVSAPIILFLRANRKPTLDQKLVKLPGVFPSERDASEDSP